MESSPPVQPPTKRKMNRWVALSIVVVMVVVGLVLTFQVGVPAIQRTIAQPRITLTDSVTTSGPCGFLGLQSQPTGVAFNLTNRGDADGYAEVLFRLNGQEVTRNTYFVPAGTMIHKWQHLDNMGDCVNRSMSAEITRTWKA